MKDLPMYFFSKFAVSIATAVALSACGGGGDVPQIQAVADPRIFVSRLLPMTGLNSFVEADQGSASLVVAFLKRAGINVTNERCSSVRYLDGRGTAGGAPSFVVIAQIDASQLSRVTPAGFSQIPTPTREDDERSFDCQSRGL